MFTSAPARAAVCTSSFLFSLILGGCASTFDSKPYRSPPPPVGLRGNADKLQTTVETVLVKNSSGSWKREAYWDEYLLTFANTHGSPVRIHRIRLVDQQGLALDPGENPWHLEAESRAWYSRHALQQNISLGAGTAITGAGRIVMPVGVFAGTLALYGLPLNAVGVSTLALPILGESLNDSSKAKQREIVDEFESRRLHLPATVSPGQVLRKSVFYRIAPCPNRLVVAYETDGVFREVTIDLAPLAGYHANEGRNLDPIPTPIAPLTPRPPI